jgi:hypothetical protein
VNNGGSRAELWSGVAYARAAKRAKAVSFVSLGLHQLGRTEIEVTCPESNPLEGFQYLLDLVDYVSRLDRDFDEGETVGRNDAERLPVRIVKSPVDKMQVVRRIDLP